MRLSALGAAVATSLLACASNQNVPGAPLNVTAVAGDQSAVVSWSAPRLVDRDCPWCPQTASDQVDQARLTGQ